MTMIALETGKAETQSADIMQRATPNLHKNLATRSDAAKINSLGDFGTNDMLVGDVLRTNEMQVWFLSEQLVDAPITRVD